MVKILLAEMKKSGRSHSVERVMASRDDILEALFKQTFFILSPAERRVFLTLCNWRSLVPVLALQAVLLSPGNEERIDVEAAVDSLEKSSLIEARRRRRVVVDPGSAGSAVFGRKKLTVDGMRPAIEADTEHLQTFGAYQPSGLSAGLKARIHHVLQSLATQRAEGRILTRM